MLDQSFSTENFRKILDYENRKGLYLEGRFFPSVKIIADEIRLANADIRAKRKVLSIDDFNDFKESLFEKIDSLRNDKEALLENELSVLSDKVSDSRFLIKLKRNDIIADKPVYLIEDKPEFFFVLKQLQYNLKKLYKVQQSSRFAIINQVKNNLDDSFPKVVIRTDIESFYESIPHDKLIHKLNEENLLSYTSKKNIRQIIKEYKILSGSTKGLPRGIGISAYLAELYMRGVDRLIQELPTVSYYARYVDDIFVIFTPSSVSKNHDYLKDIREIIESKFHLILNNSKTQCFDLTIVSAPSYQFNYLGYDIKIGSGISGVKISLSANKVNRYKEKIDRVFKIYSSVLRSQEKLARKILVKRIRFLTSNTRLVNNKKNILVGIYYSNSLLTHSSDLAGLDKYLEFKINSLIDSIHLKARLGRCKFVEGFVSKKFSPFTALELSSIVKAWK